MATVPLFCPGASYLIENWFLCAAKLLCWDNLQLEWAEGVNEPGLHRNVVDAWLPCMQVVRHS
jgi:hypothetical protein